jgi:hypothetical protein
MINLPTQERRYPTLLCLILHQAGPSDFVSASIPWADPIVPLRTYVNGVVLNSSHSYTKRIKNELHNAPTASSLSFPFFWFSPLPDFHRMYSLYIASHMNFKIKINRESSILKLHLCWNGKDIV